MSERVHDIELPEQTPREMSFWDHLEELRSRLIWSLVGIAIGTAVCAFFSDAIVNGFLLAPAIHAVPPLKIQNLKPYGQLMLYMELVFIAGALVSLPNTIYQIWKFVQPALYPNERRYVFSIVFFASFFFFLGGAFGYYVLIPNALSFFSGFGSQYIQNIIDLQAYFGFVTGMILACAVVFELPMLSFFLAKIGIINAEFLKKYRRHAVIVILLVAAAITPGPDIASQIMVAIPLYLLYEVSIIVVKVTRSKKRKREEASE